MALFRSYKKGAVLFPEGQMATETYFMISGCIRKNYIVDGEEKTTAFYTEFECVPMNRKTMDKPAPNNLVCVESTIFLVSNPSIEKLIFEKFPRLEKLCRTVSEQLLAKNQASFNTFRTSTPEQRYPELLKKRPEQLQRIPQYQLASFPASNPNL
ncbi:MAG: Crp/Fnr family transcriptional regulator [Chitinophagaceae bacterium]|nr:Crp/Fnr family transcriptional regulator [Chitinophagaceae bacterium]